MSYKIIESWNQIDGGTRYLVAGPGGEITVDRVKLPAH